MVEELRGETRCRGLLPCNLVLRFLRFNATILLKIILVQNSIFTAEAQRAQSRYFLFGGERPPNKKVSVISIQGSYHVPQPQTESDFIPERMVFRLQSPSPACADEAATARRRPDWSRRNLPQRSLRLSGETRP